MKNKTHYSIGVLLIMVLFAFVSCKSKITIHEALEEDGITVKVRGVDVANMSFEVTSDHAGTIVIPAGTILKSNDSETQNMITAATVTITFSGGSNHPVTYIPTVEVYCINYFKHAPTEISTFNVYQEEVTKETDTLIMLTKCLEGNGASHDIRNLAIWMVSDNFMNLPKDEVLHIHQKHYETKTLNEIIYHREDYLKRIRGSDPFFNNYSDDEIIEYAKDNNPRLSAKYAQTQIEDYYTYAGPLLQNCGIDISTKRFFQN